uniref:Uncharacterized protein n=1 Tax=Arundo donax TaxID=35708 RepID=A0A0A9AP10_ARUDO
MQSRNKLARKSSSTKQLTFLDIKF